MRSKILKFYCNLIFLAHGNCNVIEAFKEVIVIELN